jgi:acetolactate synthase-1/2/3 large subunit
MTDQIYQAIRSSRQPLLLAGGGCVIAWKGTDDLRAFVDSLGIPVATTLMGKGAMPDDHPLYLGNLGMHGTPQANTALGNCDLLLAVGSRFSDRIIGDPEMYNTGRRIVIHVDIDPAEIGKNLRTDIEIEDDAASFFEAMLTARPADDFNLLWSGWLNNLRTKKDRYRELVLDMYHDGTPLPPQYVVNQVATRLRGTNPLVVTDVGQHQMFVAQHYPIESPRSFITSGGLGTMGFGLPAAVGAAMAAPDRTVVLFTGDGGFQMTIQELGLLASLNLNIKILVMDNSCLGMVRQWQELFFDKHYSKTILDSNPDFVKIADAYSIPGGVADDGESMRLELDKALQTDGPYLIHCMIDQNVNVYPMIPAGKMPQDLLMPGFATDDD